MALVGEVLRFGIAGMLNTLVGLAIILFLQDVVGISPVLSNLIGYFVGFAIGYGLHKSWTFRQRHTRHSALSRYFTVIILCYLLNLAVLTALVQMAIKPSIAQLASVIVYTFAHFLLSKLYAFRSHGKASNDYS